MNVVDQLAKQMADSIKESINKGPSPYDVQAEVRRVEDGVAWVHIPGGVDETPVNLTMNAKKGDIVQVRVSGGNAWLTGNGTNPPTDDTTANYALNDAQNAIALGAKAMAAADEAEDAADRAREAANEVYGLAQEARADAATAKTSASEAKADAALAKSSATSAVNQLSVVEDVVGTLRWISEHGTYTLTSDTEVDSDTIYFSYDSTTQTYNVVVPVGTENPSQEGWYVLSIDEAVSNYVATHLALTDRGLWVIFDDNNTYALTSDVAVDSTKTYFTLSNGVYEPVSSPVVSELSTYYEITTSMTSGYRALLSHDGLTVFDSLGKEVSNFGENVIFSGDRSQYIGGEDAYIVFNSTTGEITIGGSKVNIAGANVSIGSGTRDLEDVLYNSDITYRKVKYQKARYAYSDNEDGSDLSINYEFGKGRKYRGIYVGDENVDQFDPSIYTWEINPLWASMYSDKYLHSIENGIAIYDSDLDSDTYAGLSALALKFFLDGIEQMNVGYEPTFEEYGVVAKSFLSSGSGSGYKFDNYGYDEGGARGRYIWEVRNNGHLSLKLY